jgi:hypothetical protein
MSGVMRTAEPKVNAAQRFIPALLLAASTSRGRRAEDAENLGRSEILRIFRVGFFSKMRM